MMSGKIQNQVKLNVPHARGSFLQFIFVYTLPSPAVLRSPAIRSPDSSSNEKHG